jgi:hypothetical protein
MRHGDTRVDPRERRWAEAVTVRVEYRVVVKRTAMNGGVGFGPASVFLSAGRGARSVLYGPSVSPHRLQQ